MRGLRAARECPDEGFLGRALRPVPADFDRTRNQGKRRAGRERSGRCPTDCREGLLRRGAVAGFKKGKVHLLVLGKCCKVAMEYNDMRHRRRKRVTVGRKGGASHAREERRGL